MSDAPALIDQALRYELDVTTERGEFLESCLGASRSPFNQGLALVKARLNARAEDETVRVPWSYHALRSAFRGDAIKDELAPWRSEVVIGSYQAGLEALGRALQAFSKGRKAGRNTGFPRFRSKHNPAHRASERVLFVNPRIPDARHVMLDRRLGPIRSREPFRKLTRLLKRDPDARILRATVKRSGDGYAIAFTVRRSRTLKQRRPRRPRDVIGIDLGLAQLATLSTGEAILNDHPLRDALGRLRRLQRKLDRQRRANNPGNYNAKGRARKGARVWHVSTRMRATERQIRRTHARVRNLRANRTHELTTQLVREYGIIGVESLSVSNMMSNRSLARAIADAGWGEILRQLQYSTRPTGQRARSSPRQTSGTRPRRPAQRAGQ